MKLSQFVSYLAPVALVLSSPVLAYGQVCTADAECKPGMTCQGSAVAPTPGGRPTCPAGADCPADAPAPDLVAPEANQKFCQPAPCAVDADCGGAMVCHSQTISRCSGGGAVAVPCKADAVCEPPPPATPPTCTQVTTSVCAYKWQLPCNNDSDCGSEFTCMPTVTGSCSGGTPSAGGGSSGGPVSGGGVPTGAPVVDLPAPVPSADGGTSPGEAPVCTTTTSFPGYCLPKATTCDVDADCPASWTCTVVPTVRDDGPAKEGTAGTTRPATVDGGVVTTTDPAPTAKVCQSPASFPVRGSLAADATSAPKAPATGGGPGAGSVSTESDRASASTGCSIAGASGAGATGQALGLALLAAFAVMRARRSRRR